MSDYRYRVMYSFVTFGWNVLDQRGAVVYETTTESDALQWVSTH